jgi:hypothetical protein
MADNERLRRFQLIELIGGVRTELVNDTLVGREATKEFEYSISPFLSPLTEITLRALVTDASGFQDSTDFILTVDIPRDTASTFPILTYLNDPQVNNNVVFSFQDDNNAAAYDLIQRRVVLESGSVAAKDIADTTQGGNAFTRGFVSPNNRSNNRPRAFVVLSASQFNFNRLTYQSMDQAFNANVPRSFTGPLQVGDIVILKLNLQPHYAAIRITRVQDDGPGGGLDFITFDYKRSSDN